MSPVKINRRHGGLTRAKSRGCRRPECADYTPEALNNAPKCASLKAWNPWSVRAVLSFAINIRLRLCAGTEGWHRAPPHPSTPTQTLQSPKGTRRGGRLFFLAVEYSARGCHNKGSDKKEGRGPAPHGVTVTTNGRKAMSEVLTVHQENWYSSREREGKLSWGKNFLCPSSAGKMSTSERAGWTHFQRLHQCGMSKDLRRVWQQLGFTHVKFFARLGRQRRDKVRSDAQVLEATCHTKSAGTFLGDGAAMSSLVGSAAATTCRRLSQVTRSICPGSVTAGEASGLIRLRLFGSETRTDLLFKCMRALLKMRNKIHILISYRNKSLWISRDLDALLFF